MFGARTGVIVRLWPRPRQGTFTSAPAPSSSLRPHQPPRCAFLLPASSPASLPHCLLSGSDQRAVQVWSPLHRCAARATTGCVLGVALWGVLLSWCLGLTLSFIPLEHFKILKSNRSEGILMSHSARPQGSDDFDPDPWDLQSPGQVQPPCVTSHKNRFTKNEPRKYKHSASSITCSCSISKEAVQGWLKQQKCTS